MIPYFYDNKDDNMNLEYVASGCNYMVLGTKFGLENDDYVRLVRMMFDVMKKTNQFSLLFNAFTEKGLGSVMSNYYVNDLTNIHADSGGLQVLTQGKVVNDELRNEIYITQKQNSHVAMMFDDIPFFVENGVNSRGAINGRLFDVSNYKQCARNSGGFLKRQISVFKDTPGLQTTPLLIVQGNDIKTLQDWYDIVIDTIGDDVTSVGGISSAGAVLGRGEYEEIIRAAFPFFQNADKRHGNKVHLLGIGSMRRIIPTLMLKLNIDNELHLSYDSTTHTSSIAFGRYTNRMNQIVDASRGADAVYYQIFRDDVLDYFPFLSEFITPKKFLTACQFNQDIYTNTFGNMDIGYFLSRMSFILAQIKNFMVYVNNVVSMIKDGDLSIIPPVYRGLQYVKDKETFNDYLDYASFILTSSKVKPTTSTINLF